MSSWHHAPPHYSENPDHRPPPPSEIPPQHSYPSVTHQGPPSHSQPPYHPPPPARENSGTYPGESYSRQGSVSAPTRSPAEPSRNHYPPQHSAPHDSPYYQPPPPDYHRSAAAPYGPSESQPNGTQPPQLHLQTAHEMMQGQHAGHPPPPPHHGYGHHPPHSAPPPATPGGYYPPYYDASSQQRRKPVRAAQACDSCRQRKAKCDEGRPECQHCKDNNLKCTYRELPPQKSEKHVLQISEKLELLTSSIDQLLDNQKSQQQQIQRLVELQAYNQAQPQSHPRPQPRPHTQASQPQASPVAGRPPLSHLKSEDSQAQLAGDETEEDGPGDGDKEKLDFSMPPKHTTAVHHMFEWPLIKRLLPPKQSPAYVNDLELGRGLLRLYGCGEGEDKGDGHEGAPSPVGSHSSEGRLYDDETSSTSLHGVWGNGQLPQPPTSNEHNARDHPGGLSPRGGLMLDSAAVDLYFRSYMDNMHILHPFMETKVLRQMIHTFKKKYSWDYRPNHAVNSVIGNKRKRDTTESPTPIDELSASFTAGTTTRPAHRAVNVSTIEHSVANALVLLVIALGKIAAHREPLPGPVSTASLRTSTPHTMYSTLSDLPHTKSAPASPYNLANGTQNGGVAPSPSAAVGKNMDSIPGLSYFAKAADILGELPGGVAVSHIQANLLAGLYMGQLARIIPSHHYISVACHACQVLIESTRYRKHLMGKNERNLINFAFWSCLQLESDILAEVELPPSGITRYEGRQHDELPTNITIEKIPESTGRDNILRFYSYQIQLRRTMNDIHTILYKKSQNEKSQKPVLVLVKVLEKSLHGWKGILGDWDWEEDDYQSEDINVARMRAKYYGARYIINRPILHYCLCITAPQTPSIKHSDSPQASGLSAIPSPAQIGYSPAARSRLQHEMGPPSNGAEAEIDEGILHQAKTCVEAAIRSTTVFDKVPKRLIITNIFGTAHAQFGNLLVLAATYTSPHPRLSSLVSEATLRHLFERTINLLQANSAISPVLEQDAKILQHVRSQVFPQHYAAPNMSSSFSSQGYNR